MLRSKPPIFLIYIIGILLCVLFIWSLINILVVCHRAEEIAGDKPYCIQISGEGDYREARSLVDFSIFIMRSSGSGRFMRFSEHHAQLVIGDIYNPELYHWSYWKSNFIDPYKNTNGSQPIYCMPRQHYVKTLPILSFQKKSENFDFTMAKHSFSIPRLYKPSAGPGDTFGFYFFATLPNFKPPAKKDRGQFIEVLFDTKSRPGCLQYFNKYKYNVDLDKEFGLEKLLDGKFIVYYSLSKEKEDVTYIKMWNSEWAEHVFLHNGWHYSYKIPASEIPNWFSHQQQLVALVQSFIVSKESSRNDR